MKNIEIEYKQMLNKKQYQQIRKYLLELGNSEYQQENYYFETVTLDLKDRRQALRIRVKDSSYELCLKTKQDDIIIEDNILLSKQEFEEIMIFPNKINEYLDLKFDLEIKGSLITKRIDYQIAKGVFSLDYSIYNNHEDYEIEFEANEENRKEFLIDFLAKFDIVFQENHTSKIERFMKSL